MAETALAFNQVMMLVAGLACVGIGGLLAGYEIHRRQRGVRVLGTVIGVREDNGMYRNVYRYMLPTGQMHEGTSDVGSNSTNGRQTGRTVELLVLPDDPERVSEAGSFIALIFGALLLLGGLVPIYFALTRWPVTPFVWLVVTGFIAYLAIRIRKFLIRASERKSLPEWRAERRAKLEATPVRPIEEILSRPASTELAAIQGKTRRFGKPALLVFGVLLVGLSVFIGRQTAQLLTTGERATGRVVEIRAESDSDGTTYRPMVQFQAGREAVRFRDRVGTNPPSHSVGDEVTVLYLKGSPEASAIIDRGAWNWVPALAFGLFGAGLFWAGLRIRTDGEAGAVSGPAAG